MAFLMSDGPRNWPHYILSRENLPESLVEGMSVKIGQSKPDQETLAGNSQQDAPRNGVSVAATRTSPIFGSPVGPFSFE